jgi:hypothetical protein
MAHVRFAARDPGGANVLMGFLSGRRGDAPFTFDAWSLAQASPVFRRGGVEPREFADGLPAEAIDRAWAEEPADVLVTGTSHYAPFEAYLWRSARRRGCASLAVNDAWVNLPRRFAVEKPDYVGAVDAGQVPELVALGFDSGRVITTGHPWLTGLLARCQDVRRAIVPPERDGDVHVLFVSESIASDVARGVNAPFGFDELDAFGVLHAAAVSAAAAGIPVRLAVKFHPSENPDAFLARLAKLERPHGLSIRTILGNETPYPWVLWSDLVAGVGSMLLLESIVLDRPVVSLQPGLTREDTFIVGRRGLAPTLTDPAEGRRIVSDLLSDPAARRALLERERRFVELIPPDPVSPIASWIGAHVPDEAGRGSDRRDGSRSGR